MTVPTREQRLAAALAVHDGRTLETLPPSVRHWVETGKELGLGVNTTRSRVANLLAAREAVAARIAVALERESILNTARALGVNEVVRIISVAHLLTTSAQIDASSPAPAEARPPRPCATCGKPGHRPMDHAGWDPTKEGHG